MNTLPHQPDQFVTDLVNTFGWVLAIWFGINVAILLALIVGPRINDVLKRLGESDTAVRIFGRGK